MCGKIVWGCLEIGLFCVLRKVFVLILVLLDLVGIIIFVVVDFCFFVSFCLFLGIEGVVELMLSFFLLLVLWEWWEVFGLVISLWIFGL